MWLNWGCALQPGCWTPGSDADRQPLRCAAAMGACCARAAAAAVDDRDSPGGRQRKSLLVPISICSKLICATNAAIFGRPAEGGFNKVGDIASAWEVWHA